MKASTERLSEAAKAPDAGNLWRPAGAAFLVASLAALACGFFPELLIPRHVAQGLAVPSALSVLLAAQTGFMVLLCPLVLARRTARLGAWGQSPWLDFLLAAGEYVLLVLVCVPLYAATAWMSDATARDVVRSVLYLTGAAVGAWGLSRWACLGRGWSLSAVTLAGALAVVGVPTACYLLAELTGAGQAVHMLWRVGPVTAAYSVAAARGETWWPMPLWSWCLWPTVGVALALGRMFLSDGRK